jgi:hypothetical protein
MRGNCEGFVRAHCLNVFFIKIKGFCGMKLKIEEALVILEGNQSTISLCYKQRDQNQCSKHTHFIFGTLLELDWFR